MANHSKEKKKDSFVHTVKVNEFDLHKSKFQSSAPFLTEQLQINHKLQIGRKYQKYDQ